MSVVASNNPATRAAAPISNIAFWPDLDPQHFRAAERLREDVPAERLDHALRAAMADVNRQLDAFVGTQLDAGRSTHRDIPLERWQVDGQYEQLYTRAVYGLAHADILERYVDYSATNDSVDRTQQTVDVADDYRRASRWAVAEIEGRPHATVELI